MSAISGITVICCDSKDCVIDTDGIDDIFFSVREARRSAKRHGWTYESEVDRCPDCSRAWAEQAQ